MDFKKTMDKAIKVCDEKKSVENNPPYTLKIGKFEFSVYEKAKRGEYPEKIGGGKETIGKTIKLNGKTLNEALKESYGIVGKIYTQKTKSVVSEYKNKTKKGGVALCHIIAEVFDADGNWARGSRGLFGYDTQEKWNN